MNKVRRKPHTDLEGYFYCQFLGEQKREDTCLLQGTVEQRHQLPREKNPSSAVYAELSNWTSDSLKLSLHSCIQKQTQKHKHTKEKHTNTHVHKNTWKHMHTHNTKRPTHKHTVAYISRCTQTQRYRYTEIDTDTCKESESVAGGEVSERREWQGREVIRAGFPQAQGQGPAGSSSPISSLEDLVLLHLVCEPDANRIILSWPFSLCLYQKGKSKHC